MHEDDPNTYEEVMGRRDSEIWKKSMEEEMHSLMKNET